MGPRLKLPRWVREYSLSLGIIFFIATIVAIQNQAAMLVFLVIGAVFLALSMLSALADPPGSS